MSLSNKQIALIHIIKQNLKIDDVVYRDILKKYFNVATSKELNYKQFKELLNIFKRSGYNEKQNITDVSPQQIEFLKSLYFNNVCIRNKTEEGFNNFIFSFTKKINPNVLTQKEVRKLINILKRINK